MKSGKQQRVRDSVYHIKTSMPYPLKSYFGIMSCSKKCIYIFFNNQVSFLTLCFCHIFIINISVIPPYCLKLFTISHFETYATLSTDMQTKTLVFDICLLYSHALINKSNSSALERSTHYPWIGSSNPSRNHFHFQYCILLKYVE